MLRKLIDFVTGKQRGPVWVLDHVPVQSEGPLAGWGPSGKTRLMKLLDAREKYGRAFKCAGLDQDREVIVAPDVVRVVKAGASSSSLQRRSTGSVARLEDHRKVRS